MAKPTTRAKPAPPSRESNYPLAKLLLDEGNPRFGGVKTTGQAGILDHIVEKFGVDDVLSSLAVNGYFDAEPLVCRKKKRSDEATVVEGNRRLAACLILTNDSRAVHQKKRSEQFREIWEKHGRKTIDPVPVILPAALPRPALPARQALRRAHHALRERLPEAADDGGRTVGRAGRSEQGAQESDRAAAREGVTPCYSAATALTSISSSSFTSRSTISSVLGG